MFLLTLVRCSNCVLNNSRPAFPSVYYLHSISHSVKLLAVPVQQYETKRHFSLEELGQSYVSLFHKIAQSQAVAKTHDILVYIHDTTGLPWWGTIMTTTMLMRLFITFPLAVYQNYTLAKLEQCKFEMDELVKELKKETAVAIKMFKWTEKQARAAYNRSLKKQWRLLIERDNCHPFKTTLVFWVQVPLWITLSVTLRKIAYGANDTLDAQLLALQFGVGGVYWAPNLFLPDHSLILPIALGILNLSIVELQVLTRKSPSKIQTILTNVFRGLAVFMVPIAAYVPSCLSLYWVSSSMFGVAQNVLLMSPKVKRLFRIPKTPSELERPYRAALDALQERWYCRMFRR